jgi:hypothetical protein
MERISDETLRGLIIGFEMKMAGSEIGEAGYGRIYSALTELRERRAADSVDKPVLIDCDYCKRRHDQRIACQAYLATGNPVKK